MGLWLPSQASPGFSDHLWQATLCNPELPHLEILPPHLKNLKLKSCGIMYSETYVHTMIGCSNRGPVIIEIYSGNTDSLQKAWTWGILWGEKDAT